MAGPAPDAGGATTPHTRRSIVALLVSGFCASSATMAGETALGKQVFDLTHRELDLGWLGLIEFAPAAVLVLVTGAVADRVDRRRVVFAAASAQAIVAVALAWYTHRGHDQVTSIFGLVLVLGIARAFLAPADRALPADMVPPERMPWLVARNSGTFQGAIVVGPIIGGVLYAIAPSTAYLAMAALLAIGAITIFAVEVPELNASRARAATAAATAREEGREEVDDPVALDGIRFIRSHGLVLGAMSLDLFAVLFGGAVALLPAIAETRLGAGAIGLGILRSAYGIGAGLVTAWLAIRPLRRHVGRRLLIAVAVFGVATIVVGITRTYIVAFIALMILAGADAVSVFVRATLVPLAVPSRLRGRVLAVENVFIGGSNELGAFESGIAGQALGPGPAIALGGAATIIIAASWTRLFPELRDVDQFPNPIDFE
jgi:hypothetical protein